MTNLEMIIEVVGNIQKNFDELSKRQCQLINVCNRIYDRIENSEKALVENKVLTIKE